MGTYGFSCDNIRNYEIFLTKGSIINANEDENHDLWLALRGGGPNFGIVTRFDLEALPDQKISYMSTNHTAELVDAIVYFTDHNQDFSRDALVAWLSYNATFGGTYIAIIKVNTAGVDKRNLEMAAKLHENLAHDLTSRIGSASFWSISSHCHHSMSTLPTQKVAT